MTVFDYRWKLGYDPPPTNPEDDFDTQYNDIQRDFNARWNGDGPAPQLANFRTFKPDPDPEMMNLDFSEN